MEPLIYTMDFKTSITTCLKEKYASFQGRATRSEYWYFQLFSVLSLVVVGIVGSIISDTLGMILYVVMALGLICPNISVLVRRLHDIGKSGWWYWICAIPAVGFLILLFFLITDSKGDNEYGPSPKGF